jgi:hypothetical protein
LLCVNEKNIHKEIFTVGSVCRAKRFTAGLNNSLKDFSEVSGDETEVRKWLKQESKDTYAAGFYALVTRWDECVREPAISIGNTVFSPCPLKNLIKILVISLYPN